MLKINSFKIRMLIGTVASKLGGFYVKYILKLHVVDFSEHSEPTFRVKFIFIHIS